MPPEYVLARRSAASSSPNCSISVRARDFATLNHYALRSLDSYLVKTDRGDVNREGRVFDDTYWRERNDTAWRDRSIRRYLPRLEAALAALKADPEIAALHDACVAAHRARAAALIADPAYAAMAAQIRAADPLPPGEAALRAALGYKPGTAA